MAATADSEAKPTDSRGVRRQGCCRPIFAAVRWVQSRPWGDVDNYAQALQRTLALVTVLLLGVGIYFWVAASQGTAAANSWFVMVIISARHTVILSRPSMGEANRTALINVVATAVAGAVGFGLVMLGAAHPVVCFLLLLAAIMPVYYSTKRLSLSEDFPLLFCSTVVSITLLALAARTVAKGAEVALNGTVGILIAVFVTLAFASALFPRCVVPPLSKFSVRVCCLITCSALWCPPVGGDGHTCLPDTNTSHAYLHACIHILIHYTTYMYK